MGLSMKLFLHPNHALQWHLAWLPLHHGDGGVNMDYLWHPGTFVSNSVMDFLGYVGVGLGVACWARHAYCGYHPGNYYYRDRYRNGCYRGGGAAMVLRAPVLGLAFHWKAVPLDTAIEGAWSPYIVYPDLAHGDFSVKVRYYF